MTGRRKRALAAAAAGGIACILTAIIAVSGPEDIDPARHAHAQDPALPGRQALPDLAGFAVIADRPLFRPTRRPTAPPPPKPVVIDVPPPALPPPPPANRLLAVAISPTRRAAVLQLTNGKTLVIREGGSVSGWTVTSILPDRALLSSPGGSVTLSFSVHGRSQAIAGLDTQPQWAEPILRRR